MRFKPNLLISTNNSQSNVTKPTITTSAVGPIRFQKFQYPKKIKSMIFGRGKSPRHMAKLMQESHATWMSSSAFCLIRIVG